MSASLRSDRDRAAQQYVAMGRQRDQARRSGRMLRITQRLSRFPRRCRRAGMAELLVIAAGGGSMMSRK